MYQKNLMVSELIDVYGPLLSERRREIIEAYYYDDLSLSEISDNIGISRQGVRDSIKKSEVELQSIENKLHLAAFFKTMDGKIGDLVSRIEAICPSLPVTDAAKLMAIADELKSIKS